MVIVLKNSDFQSYNSSIIEIYFKINGFQKVRFPTFLFMKRNVFKRHVSISTVTSGFLLLFVAVFFSSQYYVQPISKLNTLEKDLNSKKESSAKTLNNEKMYISNGLKCFENGWSKYGAQVFWPYYFFPFYPSLHDIFEDNGVLHVILSSFLVASNRMHIGRINEYISSSWALYLHKNNETENRDKVINENNPIIAKTLPEPRSSMINLRFPLPKEYQNKYNFATIQLIYNESDLQRVGKESIFRPPNPKEPLLSAKYYNPMNETIVGYFYQKTFYREPNPKNITHINDISYRNVPFCQIKDKYSIYVNKPEPNFMDKLSAEEQIYISPNGQKKEFLTICAESLIYDENWKNEVIYRWILFHIDQGFSPPILYINRINGSENVAISYFKKAVEENKVKLVDFVLPYAHYAHDQISQEMSCLERMKGRTVWLAFNNVDEHFFHSDANSGDKKNNLTTAEILMKYHTNVNNFKNLGALKCPNMWMQRLENDTCLLDIKQNFLERTKCIMIPENTEFFTQHFISLGKQMKNSHDIANGHFKVPTSRQDNWVINFQKKLPSPKMTEISKRVTEEMKRLFFNN